MQACAAWIVWWDPGARDAFQASANGRANLALLMFEDYKAMSWGAEAGFWAPLEVFAIEGWEGVWVAFREVERGSARKIWGEMCVVQ